MAAPPPETGDKTKSGIGDDENRTSASDPFVAECLPANILDVALRFFNLDGGGSSAGPPFPGEEEKQVGGDPEAEPPNGVGGAGHETTFRSVVDVLAHIPEDFSHCTGYLDDYFRHGCGCHKECHKRFPKSVVFQAHLDALALDHYCPDHVNHQHLLLLGAMNALVKNNKNLWETSSAAAAKRKRNHETVAESGAKPHTFFKFRGQDVCRNFFHYVFGCGRRRFGNLLKHFVRDGIATTRHESVYSNRLNKTGAGRRRRDAMIFIQNFAMQNALQIPGRYWNEEASFRRYRDLYLLPNTGNLTRRQIYEYYAGTCTEIKTEPISFALWTELWDLHYPNVQTGQDAGECCHRCREFQRTKPTNDAGKLDTVRRYQAHLARVQTEMDHYRTVVRRCGEEYSRYSAQSFERSIRESFVSTLTSMHYTLSWYTTVSLPHNPKKPQLYLKDGYKVALFGIAIEPCRKFVLYMVPEFVCHQTGQLMNVTLSILNHFFGTFRFGERHSYIHLAADGEMRRTGDGHHLLLAYLMWRTMLGLHDEFHLSSIPAGHARCWNDLFMAMFKKKFRNVAISSLAELKMVADQCCGSAATGTGGHSSDDNRPASDQPLIRTILVGDDSEKPLIPLYDWHSKLFHVVKPVPGDQLNRTRHFEIGIDRPGYVVCRTGADDQTGVSLRLFSPENYPLIEELPREMPLRPLSSERRAYLEQAIIPFLPSKQVLKITKIYSHQGIMEDEDDEDDGERQPEEERRTSTGANNNKRFKCGYCKTWGHKEAMFGKVVCPQKKLDANIIPAPETEMEDDGDNDDEDALALITSSSNTVAKMEPPRQPKPEVDIKNDKDNHPSA